MCVCITMNVVEHEVLIHGRVSTQNDFLALNNKITLLFALLLHHYYRFFFRVYVRKMKFVLIK